MSILTIQPSNIDAYIHKQNPTTNYGNATYLNIWTLTDEFENAILKFDFSALPTAVISAAELDLYYYNYAALDPVGRIYWAYELTQTGWVELETTWNSYKTGSAWATAGGDFITTNGASLAVPATYGWMSWDVLALVQHFQSVHAKVAHFLIKDGTEDGANKQASFYSNNYTVDTTKCPKLIITYTIPSGFFQCF